MNKNHSFFICEEFNCVDKKAVIKKLSKMIIEEKTCIFCGGENFKTFADV